MLVDLVPVGGGTAVGRAVGARSGQRDDDVAVRARGALVDVRGGGRKRDVRGGQPEADQAVARPEPQDDGAGRVRLARAVQRPRDDLADVVELPFSCPRIAPAGNSAVWMFT